MAIRVAYCPRKPDEMKIADSFFVLNSTATNRDEAATFCSNTFPGSRLAAPKTVEELQRIVDISKNQWKGSNLRNKRKSFFRLSQPKNLDKLEKNEALRMRGLILFKYQ